MRMRITAAVVAEVFTRIRDRFMAATARHSARAGISLAIAIACAAGVVWASIPDASGTIHACYMKSGGTRSFSDYYTAAYDRVILKSSLRDNVVFAQHNLASDSSFNEFHVILCRNVMIYFNSRLQAHVHDLLHGSLAMFGILGLGAKETLKFSPHGHAYEEIDNTARLYRRIG